MQATIHFKEDNGVRFCQQGGESEHKGERITFQIDVGCGVNVAYKCKRYRIDPSEIIGGVIDAIDGTEGGEEKPACDHEWVDARNEVVASGEICSKCLAMKPGPIG